MCCTLKSISLWAKWRATIISTFIIQLLFIIIQICLFLVYGSIRFGMYSLVTIMPTVKMWGHHSFVLIQRKSKLPRALTPRNQGWPWTTNTPASHSGAVELQVGTYTCGLCSAEGQTRGFELTSALPTPLAPNIYSLWNLGFSPWQMDSRVAHKSTDTKSLLLLIAS